MTQRTTLARFAWPLAFVAVSALTYTYLDRGRELAAGTSVVKLKSTNTVVRELREVSRLETLRMHVEKVVDVTEQQKVMFGALQADDALLFVASGEAVLGVDLGKLRAEDVEYDVHTRTAKIRLPPIETFSARLEERDSYVHSRRTGLLARRNEGLESEARKRAVAAFERAAGEASVREQAKQQAERALSALGKGFGLESLEIEWRSSSTES